MDNRPIGVFDSGVGGLSTVRELHKALPHEDIIYLGDTGRVPYGSRSRQTIRKYGAQDMRYLLRHNVKAVVTACGTVSSNISDDEVAGLGVSVPYTGVVLPSVRAACGLSKTGRIGVIATKATVRTKAYEKAAQALAPEVQVFSQACPLLVPLVENGMIERDNQITRLALEMYLAPLVGKNIDTLILGCTHFPLLYDIINDILEYKVALVDSAATAAQHIKGVLASSDALSEQTGRGTTQYYVTDTVESFCEVAKYFLQEEIGGATHFVEIERLMEPV